MASRLRGAEATAPHSIWVAWALLKQFTMRVLIAEDTESVRCALRLAMEYFGHEVVALTCDGEETLAAYQRLHPEVVLMDVRMPLLDGLRCTELLAQRDPNARVVIVTGGKTTEQDARRAGARAWLEKPFELEHLNAVVQEAGAL
jgi:CheY-like chemotaxis protein